MFQTVVKQVVKNGVGVATSLGTGMVITNVITHTTPTELTKYQKVMVGIGGVAVSGYAGKIVSDYAEGQVDDLFDGIRNLSEAIKPDKKSNKKSKKTEIEKI